MYQMIVSAISQHISQKGQHHRLLQPTFELQRSEVLRSSPKFSMILCIKVLDVKFASEFQNYIHLS